MADRYDRERRRRDWENEERLRRERRGPQGFTREDWRRAESSPFPVQNPMEDIDDYSMGHREGRERRAGWDRSPERDRWIDYGREYDPRFEETERDWERKSQMGRSGPYQQENRWQQRYGGRDFEPYDYHESQRPYGMRGERGQDWHDYEQDYGRGVYNERRDRYERAERDWDEVNPRRPGGSYRQQNRQQDERGYGNIRGRGYGWEGGYFDPYNRGFFRQEEAAHPDYLDRYQETHFGDEWDTGEDVEGEISYSYSEFWLTPGPFTGTGPKGYQRSDEHIFEDVCYRMSVNGQLDASEIDVNVEEGEVTLEGKVHDRHSKRLAEMIAESVSGVLDIHNRIRVEGGGRRDWSKAREGTLSQQGVQTGDDSGEQK